MKKRKENQSFVLFISFIFVVVFVAVLFSAPISKIERGDMAVVPDRILVEIMNPEGIKGFAFKDVAKIDCPGIVTALGVHEDKVLLRYKHSRFGKNDYTGMLPNGGLFFLDKKEFVEWKAGKAFRVQKEKRALKNLVRKLI